MKLVPMMLGIVFSLTLVLTTCYFVNPPFDVSYILYLSGGSWFVYYVRSAYLYKGKRAVTFDALFIVFTGVGFLFGYLFKKDKSYFSILDLKIKIIFSIMNSRCFLARIPL